MTKLTLTTICCKMLECFKSSIHTTIRVIKDIRSSDGIMILEGGLSSGFSDKDIWDQIQIQIKITARVIAKSVASAIAAVALRHLQWEDLNCQKKKCLRVFRNLYYKHLYCPIRTTVLHVVNTAIVIEVTAREEKAKTVANTCMVISMNVLRVQRSRSCAIYNSLCLSKVLPTALSIPAVSIDENPTSSVEADPRAACIEKATIPQHTSKIFWWHQYFKSSRNLRSVEGRVIDLIPYSSIWPALWIIRKCCHRWI